MIMIVINKNGDKILLGRNKRFPPGLYSALAGFIEPAESLEDAVRREVYEEAGVRVGRVIVYGTQPWPFPGNIMVGCIAQVVTDDPEAETIDLGNDPELADAKWFSFDEAALALKHAEKSRSRSRTRGDSASEQVSLAVPPPEAIANNLIDAVLHKQVILQSKI